MKLSKVLVIISIAASTYDTLYIWVHEGFGGNHNYRAFEVDVSSLENTNVVQSLLRQINGSGNKYTVDTDVVSLELNEADNINENLFAVIKVDGSDGNESTSTNKQ